MGEMKTSRSPHSTEIRYKKKHAQLALATDVLSSTYQAVQYRTSWSNLFFEIMYENESNQNNCHVFRLEKMLEIFCLKIAQIPLWNQLCFAAKFAGIRDFEIFPSDSLQ